MRKVAAAMLLSITGTFPMLAAEQTDPLSIIHPHWEYTYYNNYYDENYSVYQKCGFTEEKEIDGNKYLLISIITQRYKSGKLKI